MVYYENPQCYLESATDVKDKIAKIDIILNGLYAAAEKGAMSGHIQEYHIDDGQSRIRTIYRSHEHLYDGIKSFEKLKALYENKLCGRVINLRDRNSNSIC